MGAAVGRFRKGRLFELGTLGAALGRGSCALVPGGGVETPPAPPATAEAPAVDMTPAPPPPPRPARKPAPPAPGTGSAAEPTETVDPTRVIGLDQPGTADWLGEARQPPQAPPATVSRHVRRDRGIGAYL